MLISLHRRGRSGLRAALFVFLVGAISPCQTEERLALKSREANGLMAEGRFAEAVPIYRELVNALPANPGLRLNLALALHMSGRNPEAIPEFETVLKADPTSVPALLSLGMARLQLNQPAQAVEPLKKVVSLQPENPEARGLFAQALLGAGRASEAAGEFRRLTKLTPKDPRAWSGLGRCYEALAEQAFVELDRKARQSAEWSVLVAESRMAQGQHRAAFFFYRQALEAKPGMRGVHSGLAAVYRATGNPEWAAVEEAKEKALGAPDCSADKVECAFAAGRLLEAAGDRSPYWRAKAYNELAIRAFAELGRLPSSVELHALRAEIAANRGRHLAAVEEWRAALKLAPGDEGIERELTVALVAARDYEQAVPRLRKQLDRDANDPELNFLLGDSLLRMEQPEKAVPYLEKAAKRDPEVLAVRASLGQALARIGRAAESIPHLEAALALDDDGSLHYQLSRAYQAIGDTAKAREALVKYQEIRRSNEEAQRDLEEQVQITAP
ncbi:MAG: tetratricopeptide repeat protein [Bryobacteraceae bacterium]